MPKTFPQIRIVSEFPTPHYVAEYEPFQPLMSRQFAIATTTHVNEDFVLRLRKQCQKGFASNHSIGFCRFAQPKAIFFDMDSTVIEEESVVELAKIAGIGEHVNRITEAAMAGHIDFEQALRERVQLLAGLATEDVQRTGESLTLSEGIMALAAFCRMLQVPIFLVSGGFVSLASLIQKKVGFAQIRANILEEKDGRLTGGLIGPVVDASAKRDFVIDICRDLGCDPMETCAVGDGANDRLMLQAVGCAVGYRAKPTLHADLHGHINRGGHAFLAPLLFGRDLTSTRI